METWQAADSANIDALVLRADTEVVRLFAAATGNSDRNPAHDTLPRDQLDRALRICLRAADLAGPDPMPWVSLLTLSRLYGGGHQDSNVWWQALQARDPYNREAHHQVLRHLSARWHGSHGSMYDFAHDRASGAPDGSPLVVLLQAARAEHFRHHWESEVRGQGPGQPWRWDDGIHYELRFTMNKWIRQRRATAQDVADLNILVHALVRAGWLVAAREVFTVLGNRPTRAPWEYTGDPLADFTRWRNKLIGKI
ncbi:hypothetical protein [Streptomyces sp. 1222.5]|uniref:hypothetical protein n=1 Tax=Streptomyces sp. 1222.5 TaxID=1881026 RepID=UPI003EBE7F84